MRDWGQVGVVLVGVAFVAGLGGYIVSEPYRRERFMALLESPSGFLESSPVLVIGALGGVLLLFVGVVLLAANKDGSPE